MKKLILMAAAALALAVPVVASQAAVPGIKGGKFEVTCKFSNHNQVDPIVMPGVALSSHLHDFFGNRGVTATSTPDGIRGGATSCTIPQDSAAYWVPAAYRTDTGAEVTPVKVFAYYFGDPAGNVQTIPANAEVVAGNSHATAVQGKAVVSWSCGNGGNNSHSPVRSTPYDCTDPANGVVGSQGVVAIIAFPYCWDGTGLATPDFSYGDAGGVCAAGTIRLPQLQLHVHYGSSKSNPGFQRGDLIQLASDQAAGETGGITEHADVMFAWDQAKFNALVAGCLNLHRDCGFLTTGNPGPS